MSTPTAFPLHQYASPNGSGLCRYESGGKVCGHPVTYVLHINSDKPILVPQLKDPFKADPDQAARVPKQRHPFRADPDGLTPSCQVVGCAATSDAAIHQPLALKRLEEGGSVYLTLHEGAFAISDPPTTEQVVAMFHDAALRLAVVKDAAYAKAWVEQGYMGNVARILSKAARLRAMVWCDQPTDLPPEVAAPTEQEAETIRDTLLDMANLCAFAAHNMQQGNRWGDRG